MLRSSFVVVKEEVTCEVDEEDQEELKRRRRKEWKALLPGERRALVKRICAGEDVPGVGEEERRRIMEKHEKQKKKHAALVRQKTERIRRVCAGEEVPGVGEEERRRIVEQVEKAKERSLLRRKEKRELARRLIAGEDVPGVREEERKRIIEKEERRKQKNREYMRKISDSDENRKQKALYAAARAERIRRVCAGEDVPGVGEEERRRIIEKEEERKKWKTFCKRERQKRIRRICAGEDVPGVGEEERKRIIEKEERRKQKNREYMRKISDSDEKRKQKALYAAARAERIRRVCAGEDVPGVGEEERRRIIEKEEERKKWKTFCKRERQKRIRRICAGEDVPGVGEEERRRIIEKEEKRKEAKRLNEIKETEGKMEARLAKQKFNNLVRRVQRTDEEKEELRRRNYFNRQARLAMVSEEEREEEARRKNEKHREWLKNLSEEKRRKHYKGLKRSSKRWQQKMKEKDPEELKKRMQKYKSQWLQRFGDLGSFKNRINITRKRYEGMSEEAKTSRLNHLTMYQQKRNLRRKLEGTMDDEEIEKRLDELDKRLREELGIGPPRPSGLFGRKEGSDCGAVHSDADVSCSTQVSTEPIDKEEVGQRSDHFSIDLSATTFYADSQADPEEQAESYFCDFDEDDGASMASPPEPTHLNNTNPSSHLPPPQLEQPVALSNAQEIIELILSCEYCECSLFLTENYLKSHLEENDLKICWKCPSCKEVLIADPPRPMGRFGEKGTDCGDVNVGASCTGNVGKQEVGQCSDNYFVTLNPATCYPDSQAELEEPAAESYFCDFDERASMPSPPESIQLNTPSPQSPRQQLEPVAPSTVPETAEMTFSCDYCECSAFLTEIDLKSHLHDNHLKICWKCPPCKEVLIADPPGPMGRFGEKGTDCGDVNVGASCSEESCTGNVGKQEVGQCSDHHFVNLNPATCYPDSQAEEEEPAAESYLCDFDEGDGASMPPPPELIQLNTSSPQSPLQQLEPVAPSTVPKTDEMTFSCDYCECSPFVTENDLKSHLHDNHLKICWKCPSCKEVMISAKHLSEHFKAVHKKPSISSTVDTQTTVGLQAKEP